MKLLWSKFQTVFAQLNVCGLDRILTSRCSCVHCCSREHPVTTVTTYRSMFQGCPDVKHMRCVPHLRNFNERKILRPSVLTSHWWINIGRKLKIYSGKFPFMIHRSTTLRTVPIEYVISLVYPPSGTFVRVLQAVSIFTYIPYQLNACQHVCD
jgi:hypothetical protein